MRLYYRIFVNAIAVHLAYRWNVVAGALTQAVQLVASLFIWRSIFQVNPAISGYTFRQMATYLLLTALLGTCFSPAHIFRLSGLVRKGTLSAYLVRPYSFLGDSFALFAGSKVVEGAAAGLFLLALGLAGAMELSRLSAWALLLVLCNLLLLFVLGSLIGALSFWLIEMWPLKPLYHSLMALLGGALFPLDLLPLAVRQPLQYTPFSLFGFVNARALQGALSPGEQLRYMAASLVWSAACLLLYSWTWHRGLRRYEGVNA